ncbi:MAG: hypothetical protein ACLQMF_20125 [Rectinemataceae bacterium]
MSHPSRVSFALDADELREVTVYAMYKHIGGTRPVSAMAKEALFAWMRKYPIPEKERARLEAKYDNELTDAQAVQPELVESEKKEP